MKMKTIPEHTDLSVNYKQGSLPFFIGIHEIVSTTLHFHEHVEFSLVISGSGTETINGIAHRLKPGVASFILPNHMHEIRCDEGQPIRKYCCMFDVNILINHSYDTDWCDLLYKIGTQYPAHTSMEGEEAQYLDRCFHKLLAERVNPRYLPGRNTLICSMLMEGVLRFTRSISAYEEREEYVREPAIKQPFWPILQYVHAHYSDHLSLEHLADHFGISPSYVSRIFKQYMGTSFLTYLHQLRVETAAGLLTSTNMSILDIAIESGFESVRTFTRVFREQKGEAPSQFRSMRVKSAP